MRTVVVSVFQQTLHAFSSYLQLQFWGQTQVEDAIKMHTPSFARSTQTHKLPHGVLLMTLSDINAAMLNVGSPDAQW